MMDIQKEREEFEIAYSEIFSPIVKRPYPVLENGDYKYIEIDQAWKLWQAKSQAVPKWISVEDALPPYGKPVQVYCGNSSYKHEGLKQTVASYECAKDLIETCEHLDEGDDVKDSWIAHSSLFDGEYGGRFLNEDVTHWRKLPESPVKAQEQSHESD